MWISRIVFGDGLHNTTKVIGKPYRHNYVNIINIVTLVAISSTGQNHKHVYDYLIQFMLQSVMTTKSDHCIWSDLMSRQYNKYWFSVIYTTELSL